MNCFDCGETMESRHQNYKYTESGLSNVTLADVEVRQCPRCGYDEVVIPRMAQLHRNLAEAVARRPGRLVPEEIRFLRQFLGWSGIEFARAFGVAPETVSRWENGPGTPSPVAEKLLRVLAITARGSTPPDLPGLSKDQKPSRYEASLGNRWKVKAA